MVSAQERLTRTFTRSSHTYTRTERTEISKTRGGETKREVRVEESTQLGGGGSPFRDVFGDFLGRESLSGFAGITARPEGESPKSKSRFWIMKTERYTDTQCPEKDTQCSVSYISLTNNLLLKSLDYI